MSQNEKQTQNDEQIVQAVFSKLNKTSLEPSPYLKTRVLAHLKDGQKQQKTIRFWQFLSAGSFAVMILIGVYSFNLVNKQQNQAVTDQAYVIHVEFNQNDLSNVAKAEVVLPDDVQFKSSKESIRNQHKMTLPIQVKTAGRGKLPFVVTSASGGEKDILVRLLDENNNLVREQVLKFKFSKNQQGELL